jgi:hypothetical protein
LLRWLSRKIEATRLTIVKWVSQTWVKSGVGTRKSLTRSGERPRKTLKGKLNNKRDLVTMSVATLIVSLVTAEVMIEVAMIEVPITVGTARIKVATEVTTTAEVTIVVTDGETEI